MNYTRISADCHVDLVWLPLLALIDKQKGY